MLVWLRGQNVILGILWSKCNFGEFWGGNVISESLVSKCDFEKVWGQNVILRSFGTKVVYGEVWDQVWAWVWFKMDWNVEMDRVGLKLEFGVG